MDKSDLLHQYTEVVHNGVDEQKVINSNLSSLIRVGRQQSSVSHDDNLFNRALTYGSTLSDFCVVCIYGIGGRRAQKGE